MIALYGPEGALEEASKMKEKVEGGEAENYTEAEHLVAVEENEMLAKMDEVSRNRVHEINDELLGLEAERSNLHKGFVGSQEIKMAKGTDVLKPIPEKIVEGMSDDIINITDKIYALLAEKEKTFNDFRNKQNQGTGN